MINNLEVVIYLRELGFDIRSEFEIYPNKVSDNYISFDCYNSSNLLVRGSFVIDTYLKWLKMKKRNDVLDIIFS